MKKDLLGIADLSSDEIYRILDTAGAMREIGERPIKKVPTLRGKTVVNLFYEPSTRTRMSFEIAEKRLSADTLNIAVATSSVAIGGLLMLPLALATMPNAAPSAKSITAAAVLGALSTGASSALFYWMLSWHGAARAALLTYVTPVFTLALGAWFLGEPLTLGKVLGLCLIVFGIALGARKRRVPASQPTILAATD